ncbi:hypothetical protein KUTeg_014443 [Tegillarca granosa]|uniref:SprT-like domain-containing protein n=1 Tax=Tegillarca granosa TaxID=220873 RepID=A0ABQ9EWY5_TEGGR|nr:hypothetical protein KUTeg_014443 [Tegillarca granosa]
MLHIQNHDIGTICLVTSSVITDLQQKFDQESQSTPKYFSSAGSSSSQELSPVDPQWETLDPNPDIRALFLQFNEQFFWGRLAGIEVKWSPRMTLCAGLCCYEGRGGLCSVRLSVPLLKLRPRKDLVETLLHEMIHAYLFVTDNNKVYHSFHDEVAEYRQHWWRCNGPCQNRKPYFGYVKRAMNRAPSARDPWFKDHQNSCNGTFIKIKEPENYVKDRNMDIRVFAGKGHSLNSTKTSDMTSVTSVVDGTKLQKGNSSPSKDKFEMPNKGSEISRHIPTDSDSDTEIHSGIRKSVSSGGLADANRKPHTSKKKKFVRFYSTDSDDEIPILSSQKSDSSNEQKTFGDNSNTCNSNNLNTGQMLLSDSEDELFANINIPQLSSDKLNNKENCKTEENDNCYSDSQGSHLETQSHDSSMDVRLKLREVWGKKQDMLSKNKKTNVIDKPDIRRDSNLHNERLFGKQKRPCETQDDIQHIKRTKVSDSSEIYSYTKIEDVFSRMKSPTKVDRTERNNENRGENMRGQSTSVLFHDCPVCSKPVPAEQINSHLDIFKS